MVFLIRRLTMLFTAAVLAFTPLRISLMQQICDEEANDDSNYPGSEYRIWSGLCTDCYACRWKSTENYSAGNNIKNYVKETYTDKDQGLLYSSEDAARCHGRRMESYHRSGREILTMNVINDLSAATSLPSR